MWRHFWTWIRGHTIQAKIGWSFTLIRGLLYPVVILAMIYFFWMARLVNQIAQEDARLIRIAELLDVNFLEVRKAEKNFVLLGDRTYLDRHRVSTRTLRALLAEGKMLAKGEPGFAAIERTLGEYLAAFDELALQGPVDRAARRRSVAASLLAEYQRGVEAELEAFRKLAPSRPAYERLARSLRDRLAALVIPLETATQGEEPAIPPPLFQRLRQAGDEVQRLALELAERNWQELETHRQQALHLRRTGLWVIGIVLTLTFSLNTFLTYLLPRRILRPVRELTDACRRIEAGDLTVELDGRRQDELGDLARAFNGMLAAIRARTP